MSLFLFHSSSAFNSLPLSWKLDAKPRYSHLKWACALDRCLDQFPAIHVTFIGHHFIQHLKFPWWFNTTMAKQWCSRIYTQKSDSLLVSPLPVTTIPTARLGIDHRNL